MTSKDALEKLLHFHICYSCTSYKDCCKTCDSRLCYEEIKKDLEVLEALKENYIKAIKRENHLMINDMDLVDARDVKVKEWLEKKFSDETREHEKDKQTSLCDVS